MLQYVVLFFFFFQAEDGIRDVAVTGVQTCALPISYGYRYAALYSTCYDPFFYDPFLCYDPIFSRPYGFYGYGFYGYGYRPYYGGRYSFSNRPRNLFINRVRNGTGVQMYFKDRLRSHAAASGVGPRVPVPRRALGAPPRPHPPPLPQR